MRAENYSSAQSEAFVLLPRKSSTDVPGSSEVRKRLTFMKIVS